MTTNILIAAAIASLCYFILIVFITRWIFRIDTIVENQFKQYQMLRQIANKLGVDEALINEVDEGKKK